MDIKIDLSKMNHLKEKSFYNYNYYSYGNSGVELLQVCDEQFGTYDYYLIGDDESKVLLGSSQEPCEEVIDFMTQYT